MNELGKLLEQADALKKTADIKGSWSPEDYRLYEQILGRADEARLRLEVEKKHEALKSWASQSNGQSMVLSGFGREAAQEEGVIHPQIVAEDKGSYELWATGSIGAAKLRSLKSGEYKDAFVDYIRQATFQGPEWRSAMKGEAMKVLMEGQDTAGGFWVPPDIRSDVIKKIATTAVIRNNAFVFTTGSDLVTFPKAVYTTDNKYTSAVRFSWVNEAPASDIAEATNPAAGRIQIPVYVATAAIFLTRQIIEDAQFDLLGYCSSLLGEAFGLGEEDAFWNGNGTAQPQGLLNHANATVAVASGGMYVVSGTSAAVTWGGTSVTSMDTTKGLLGMEANLPPQYEKNAKFYFSKKTKAAIRGLTDAEGRPFWATTDSYPNFANGYVSTLLGYPYETAQFAPELAANSYSVALGDMTGYYIADRIGLSVQVFNELRGLKDEVVLYARKRVGGQLVDDWKMKLLKAAAS